MPYLFFRTPAAIVLCGLLLACAGRPPAGPDGPVTGGTAAPYRQLTTHPASDDHPVAGNGYLLFMSDRSGNPDIWLHDPDARITRRVTDASASDTRPAISPDGRYLAFVSTREDGNGDIWIARFRPAAARSIGTPRKLTGAAYGEGRPTWSPDGRQLAFVSGPAGNRAVQTVSAGGGGLRRLSRPSASDAAWSPQGDRIAFVRPDTSRGGTALYAVTPDGQEERFTDGRFIDLSPAWSPDGTEIAFCRRGIDTDNSGGIDLKDRAAVMVLTVADGRTRQLTDYGASATSPAWSDDGGTVYFGWDRSGNRDIWEVDASGAVRTAADAAAQLALAGDEHAELWMRLLRYAAVYNRFDNPAIRACAMRESAVLLHGTGLTRAAAALLGRVHAEASAAREECGLAAVLQVSYGAGRTAGEKAAILAGVLEDYGAYPTVRAAALLARGEQLAAAGDDAGALASLSAISDACADCRREAARGRLLAGDIYVRFGNTAQVTDTWVDVCNEFRDLPGIPEAVAGRIVTLLAGTAGGDAPVAEIRTLVERFRSRSEPLAARLQLRIAGLLRQSGDAAGAAAACDEALRLTADAGMETAGIELELAGLLHTAGSSVRAEALYRQLASGTIPYIRRTAVRRLTGLLDDAGETLLADHDVQLAQARFMAAAKIDYDDTRAHRGLIDCHAVRGQTADIAAKYENRIFYHPESAIDHYALGYALIYLADHATGKKLRRLYRRAERHLDLARRYRPGLVRAYLTLGYLYEVMEQRNVSSDALLFERAVETQRMGMELNDERADPLLEADFCQNIANNYEKLNMFEQAARYYRRALDLGIRFRAPLQELTFYRRLGFCLHRTDRYEQAVEQYLHAYALADSMDSPLWRIAMAGRIALASKEQADLFRESARTYEQQAAFDRAKEMLDRADRMYDRANRYNRKALAASTELQLGEPDGHRHAGQENIKKRDIASNLRQLGEYRDAVRSARESQTIIDRDLVAEQTDPDDGKLLVNLLWFIPVKFPMPDMTIGGSRASNGFPVYMQSALNYSIIGQSMVQLGDYAGALEAYRSKRRIYRQHKDAGGESVILNNIGFIHYHMHRPDSADAYFAASGNICRLQNLPYGERVALFNRCALALERIAGLLENARVVRTADINGVAALAASGLRLSRSAADSLAFENAAASAYLYGARALDADRFEIPADYGDPRISGPVLRATWLARAGFMLERALGAARGAGHRRYALRITGNLAAVRYAQGYARQAAAMLTEARESAVYNEFRDVRWRLDQSLAVALTGCADAGADTLALFYLREAADLLETESHGTGYSDLAATRTPFANEMETGGRSARMAVARVYTDLISLLMRRNEYVEALEYTERQRVMAAADMFRANGVPFLKRHLSRELDRNLLGWVLAYEDDVARLEQSVHRARYRNEPADSLIDRLNAARERLAEHLAVESAKNGPAVSLVRPRTVPLDGIRSQLDDRTALITHALCGSTLYIWVTDRNGTRAHSVEGAAGIPAAVDGLRRLISGGADISRVNAAAGGLYRLLLAPVGPSLEGRDRLVFVPGPQLYGTPFSALHDGTDYLARNYAVTVCPSMTFWYDSFRRRNVNTGRKLYAVADGNADSTVDGTVLAGAGLTEPALCAALENHDVIQLEVPVVMGGAQPLFAAFRLNGVQAGTDGSGNDDGMLHLYELLGYRLRASLLSVFFTGLDRSMDSDEWMLLALTAGYTGVPTLLHTLWVEEPALRREAAELLDTYAAEYPLDDALAEVKAALMDKYSHPRFWAGLRLVGFGGMSREQMRTFAADRFNRMAQLGVAAQKRGKWDDAYRYFSAAASMARELGKTAVMPKIQSALVNYAYRGGNLEKASYHQQQLLDLAGTDDERRRSLRQLARFAAEGGRYDAALGYEHRLRGLAAGAADSAGSYLEAAGILLRAGRHDAAVAAADSARDLYTYSSDPAAGDAALLAVRVLLDKGDYAGALGRLEPLLKAWNGSGSVRYIQTLQYAGFCLEKLGDYEAAATLQEQALALLPDGEQDGLRIRSYQHLANCRWYTGNLNDAVRNQRRALETARRTGDVPQEIVALSTFGLISLSLGRPDEALEYEKRALTLATESGSADGMAAVHNNLGLVFRQRGNERTALSHFRQALEIDRKANLLRGLAYDYRNIGISYERLGEPVKAGTYLEKALDSSRRTANRENETKVLYSLGTVAAGQGESGKATRYLEDALKGAEELGLQDIRWRALRRLGGLHRSAGRTREAYRSYDAALDVVEAMRAGLEIEEYKTGFMDGKLDVYRDLVLLLLENGEDARALGIAERAKSRNFLDLLGNREIRFTDTVSNELATRERELKRRISAESRTLTMPGTDRSAVEDSLAVLKKEYGKLLIRIRQASPRLASMVSIDPVTADDVRAFLPAGTALLEYFQAGDRLVTWCITRDEVTAEVVTVSDTALNARIGDLRNAIRTLTPVDEQARELYRLLIRPVRGHLGGITRLCIVPHGGLHYLPFAALQNGDGRYLLEEFALSGSPSASVLRHCLAPGERPRKTLLALGNPDLNNPGFDLPFAQKEVESILWQYPDHKVFLGADVTEARVREYAGSYDIIHFACHGEFDDANPMFSALLLTPDGEDDGRLEVNEIFGLQLKASLVTLSACETGLGKIEKGDDVVGLTRAFITAGTPAIVASLWKISDVASAVLIKRFYRYLKTEGTADALRRAQLFIKDKYGHPAYWASFTLSGDFR